MQITEKTGMTLLELIVCTVIIGILSSTAVPIARNVVRQQKEELLRENLREMRKAIDRFYERKSTKEPGLEDMAYYPASLDELVDARLLRKIPVDPFTERTDWKTRSSTDEKSSESSNMQNVFDVYSASDKIDARGQPYREW